MREPIEVIADLQEDQKPLQTLQDETSTLELSVVMPCLNESETLEACIKKAQRALRAHHIVGEIIVADNGSADDSCEIAQRLGARLINVDKRGYGSALIAGIAAARGKYVLMGDADDSYDFAHIPRFLEKLREGFDLVVGNRFEGGIASKAMPPLHRYLGNPALSWFGRLFFHCPTGDIYCGLRAFNRDAILRMDLRTTGMEFAIEMVVKATLLGLRVGGVPTTLSPGGRSRRPHLRTWLDGWRTLRFMLLYSPTWLFFYPGALLMLAGLGTALWLLPGPRVVRGVALDAQTLLYAAMVVLIGFQAICFAVFARTFAITEHLLPDDALLNRFFRVFTLEKGLAIGASFVLGGLAGSIYAVYAWSMRGFGNLDFSSTLRVVIPAATAITLGFQIILSSFLVSLLGLARR
ncbi:MAG TPA: glycosyltransferase family 2 protein [Terriglobales bacterium]|nr:glycosyltransferase family 2 protein [Terriglobales bacterium]